MEMRLVPVPLQVQGMEFETVVTVVQQRLRLKFQRHYKERSTTVDQLVVGRILYLGRESFGRRSTLRCRGNNLQDLQGRRREVGRRTQRYQPQDLLLWWDSKQPSGSAMIKALCTRATDRCEACCGSQSTRKLEIPVPQIEVANCAQKIASCTVEMCIVRRVHTVVLRS